MFFEEFSIRYIEQMKRRILLGRLIGRAIQQKSSMYVNITEKDVENDKAKDGDLKNASKYTVKSGVESSRT